MRYAPTAGGLVGYIARAAVGILSALPLGCEKTEPPKAESQLEVAVKVPVVAEKKEHPYLPPRLEDLQFTVESFRIDAEALAEDPKGIRDSLRNSKYGWIIVPVSAEVATGFASYFGMPRDRLHFANWSGDIKTAAYVMLEKSMDISDRKDKKHIRVAVFYDKKGQMERLFEKAAARIAERLEKNGALKMKGEPDEQKWSYDDKEISVIHSYFHSAMVEYSVTFSDSNSTLEIVVNTKNENSRKSSERREEAPVLSTPENAFRNYFGLLTTKKRGERWAGDIITASYLGSGEERKLLTQLILSKNGRGIKNSDLSKSCTRNAEGILRLMENKENGEDVDEPVLNSVRTVSQVEDKYAEVEANFVFEKRGMKKEDKEYFIFVKTAHGWQFVEHHGAPSLEGFIDKFERRFHRYLPTNSDLVAKVMNTPPTRTPIVGTEYRVLDLPEIGDFLGITELLKKHKRRSYVHLFPERNPRGFTFYFELTNNKSVRDEVVKLVPEVAKRLAHHLGKDVHSGEGGVSYSDRHVRAFFSSGHVDDQGRFTIWYEIGFDD